MAKQKKQKKQKKIWVPAYDYDADGQIKVYGDALIPATETEESKQVNWFDRLSCYLLRLQK